MENKYLQVRKENIFTKFINFFRKVFYREQNIKEEKNVNIETENIKKDFLNEIKLEHEEDSVLINLQKKYENKEIELSSMSDEEIHNLNLLYKRQIEDLSKKLDNKKTELNMIKNRIKSYSATM